MTTLEASRLVHFGNMTNTQSISLVQIGNVPYSALNGGSFTFSIPGVATNLVANTQFVQKGPNGDFVMWAMLANHRGYFAVASNSSGKVAYAQVDGEHYTMYLLSYRYNALVKTSKYTDIIPSPCLPTLENPEHITDPVDCDVDGDCDAVVSVLVLLTPEALNWLGANYSGLESVLYVMIGLHTVNFALINSGVYNKTVRFIIEPYNFNFPLTPPNLFNDLNLLNTDPIAIGRRNTNRADLMMLLADSRYFPFYAGGILPGSGSSLPYLGITSLEYLFAPDYTFAHELGHLFLLNHNRISNDGDFPYWDDEYCPFGWRFHNSSDAQRKTIMAVFIPEDQEPGAITLANYSNPNILFEGQATGTPIDFNARQASHNLCDVDDYFIDDELKINITGPDFICDEYATYTVNITPPGAGVQGIGPYSIIWRINDNQYFTFSDPGTPLGSANPLTIYSGALPIPVFWLFVSVSSADGVVVNDIIKVDNPCGVPTPLIGGSVSVYEENLLAEGLQFELFPNPTNQNLRVDFLNQIKGNKLRYTIINAVGEVVVREFVDLQNQKTFDIDLKSRGLTDGLYYLNLNADAFSGVQKFVINH